MMVACLENLGSERLEGHHLLLAVGCSFLPPAVQDVLLDLEPVELGP